MKHNKSLVVLGALTVLKEMEMQISKFLTPRGLCPKLLTSHITSWDPINFLSS